MKTEIKLNLGCGYRLKEGYINVDKYGAPDIQLDLEVFPWPWEDSSVSEIVMNHVMEHLGQDTETYLTLIKEIYRVCQDQAILHIVVPHPRHDDFLTDPTHVRKITPKGLEHFSKKINKKWIQEGYSNTPLGIYLDVDLELTNVSISLDPYWSQRIKEKKLSRAELASVASKFNNVVKEYIIDVKVIKES